MPTFFSPRFMPDIHVPSLFPPTRWTLLHRVRSGTEAEARQALETLCRAYWHPLYCVARQKGLDQHDAEDGVQGFFASILRRETFATVDPTAGKLRQLLLTAFGNYCTQQWHKTQRLKRGADCEHLLLSEFADAEQRYLEAGPASSVEAFYNREWAKAVMARGLEALRADYVRRGWTERYEMLVGALLQQNDEGSLKQLAGTSGTSYAALRVTLHRMRSHYRDMIERELAITIDSDDPRLIREEMTELFKAFS